MHDQHMKQRQPHGPSEGCSPFRRRVQACVLLGLALGPAWVSATDAPTVPADAAVNEPVTVPARPGPATGRIEAWVILAMPGTVAMPARTSVERRVHQGTVEAHQSSLVQAMVALGAQERGRQTLTRSAVLVEVDEAALARIAQLPGVARVQRVTHLHSTDGAGLSPQPGRLPAAR